MAVTSRGVDGGTDINVLVDPGADGDMQVVKLAIGATTAEDLAPGDTTNGLDVDVTRVIPGTSATHLGKAEDAVAATGDTGVFALAIRRDTPTSDAADGDYHGLHVDSTGRLQVNALAVAGSQVEDAVAGSGDAGMFMLAVRRDSAAGNAAAGDYHELQVDATGHLRTIDLLSEVAISNSTASALDSDGPVSKASAGTLYGFSGYAAAAGYVQVHDKSSAPSSSNVPKIVIPVESGKPFSWDGGMRGRAFSSGIAFGFSSTGPTFTDGGNNMWIDAQYS